MALYTFIMEFMGGTYISQVREKTLVKACLKWARTLNSDDIKGLGPKGHDLLIREVEEECQPVPISDTRNVWCTSARIKGRLGLIHVVQTSED